MRLPAAGVRPEDPAAAGATTAASARSRTRSAYLPALDGLRAVAVAAVVAFHLGHLRGGFLGVDVFFVISGYLITRLLLAEHERTGAISLGQFWLRRFRRLVPALAVVLVAVAVASRAWLPGWRIVGVRDDAFSALAYVANWRFSWSGQSYFARGVGPSPLRHTWSLAIEEQFYVVWPLVVLAAVVFAGRARRASTRTVVAVVAGGATVASALWMVAAADSADDLSRVYYGTDTRVFALAAGSWLATWWDGWLVAPTSRVARRHRASQASAAGAVALVGLVVVVVLAAEDQVASYRYAFQAAAALAAVAVAGLVAGQGPVSTVLGSSPLRWVGRRSYGIYLWSWPIQVLLTARFDLDAAPLAVVVVLGSVALAAASFTLVEEPIRTGHRLGRRHGAERPAVRANRVRRVPGAALGTVALAAVVAIVAGVAVGAPSEPSFLRTSTDEVAAGALRPAVAPVGSSTSAAPGPSPFDASAPLLVSSVANVDPGTVRGRSLRVLVAGDSVTR